MFVPDSELHDEIPDTVPPFVLSGNVTDHVAFAVLDVIPFSSPGTDGSKIMDVQVISCQWIVVDPLRWQRGVTK